MIQLSENSKEEIEGFHELLLNTPNLCYSIFQNMTEGIVITDTKANILHANQAYCSISGYTLKELIGRNVNVLKSNLHDQSFYQGFWNCIISNGKWTGEIWNRHQSGRLYLQKVSIFAIRDEKGRVIQYAAVTTDISEEDKLRKDIVRTGILQKTLLPSTLCLQSIIVETVFMPLNYIGGDFYDFYWDQENQILSGYIIDIMGHGVTAAFQNSVLRVLFSQNFSHNSSLIDVLSNINCESTNYFLEDTFAAGLCFRMDIQNGTLTYACAGMNKFIKCQANGEMVIVKQKGPYLGVMEHPAFTEHTISIAKGDSFYFMTDGFMDLFEKENRFRNNDFKENINKLRGININELKDDASAIGIFVKEVGGSSHV
ncbi:PAS domain S-box-containing protein [Cytobacillus eiseniae]|uniref:PAS domain S-box-containing protein n=1 Tax=Cytobacillus eiseniae TaxID=762947 RepID=A0ABS4R9C0_9BACI|nr:SpoIIE family protein phosphatase [Cytobacillus eiseniae]MBP2239480.1 PAS domain S-box-containing protein [Cytobacillus eiseniae]